MGFIMAAEKHERPKPGLKRAFIPGFTPVHLDGLKSLAGFGRSAPQVLAVSPHPKLVSICLHCLIFATFKYE
jgi:hypothetical protein